MIAYSETFKIELRLFTRQLSGPFFTFIFPSLLLVIFETILPSFVPLDTLLPHYIGLVVIVPGLLTFPLSIAEYRHQNIYKRLEATNFGMNRVLMMQFLVHLLMTLLGIFILLLIAVFGFKLQLPPNLFLFSLALMLAMLNIFAVGFTIVTFAPNLQLTSSLSMILYFGMIYLSGAALPVELFPTWLQRLSNLLPLTQINLLMLKIWDNGTAEQDILGLFGKITGIAILLLTLSLLRKKQRPWY